MISSNTMSLFPWECGYKMISVDDSAHGCGSTTASKISKLLVDLAQKDKKLVELEELTNRVVNIAEVTQKELDMCVSLLIQIRSANAMSDVRRVMSKFEIFATMSIPLLQ